MKADATARRRWLNPFSRFGNCTFYSLRYNNLRQTSAKLSFLKNNDYVSAQINPSKEIKMKRIENNAVDRRVYSIAEAAAVAGVGTASIYRGVAEGRIPHLRNGKCIILPRRAFDRWLDSCGETGSWRSGDAA